MGCTIQNHGHGCKGEEVLSHLTKQSFNSSNFAHQIKNFSKYLLIFLTNKDHSSSITVSPIAVLVESNRLPTTAEIMMDINHKIFPKIYVVLLFVPSDNSRVLKPLPFIYQTDTVFLTFQIIYRNVNCPLKQPIKMSIHSSITEHYVSPPLLQFKSLKYSKESQTLG